MISHTHKFVFTECPKTASSSIITAFESLNIYRSSEYQTHSVLPLRFIDTSEYFTFRFTRNPWDKMVSLYFFYRHGRVAKRIANGTQKSRQAIKDHKAACKQPIMQWIRNKIKHRKANRWAFDNPANYNFVGRFENLQEDFDVICDKIGISRQELSHENKTKHKYYSEYYDDETRQIVAEKYAKDIEYFGYEFGE